MRKNAQRLFLLPAVGRVPFAWAEDQYQKGYLKVDTEKAEVFLKDYQEVCKGKKVRPLLLKSTPKDEMTETMLGNLEAGQV